MICWHDVWETTRRWSPIGGIGFGLLTFAAVVVWLFHAKRMQKGWAKVVSRLVGALIAVPLLLAAIFFSFLLLILINDPRPENIVARSPDQRQNARLTSYGNDGQTAIELTPNCSCNHTRALIEPTAEDLKDAKLQWLDDQHLYIKYFTSDPGGERHYSSRVGTTTILCTILSKPRPPSFRLTPGLPPNYH